jgi:hypothetical protein
MKRKRNGKRIKKKFKILIDTATKKGKVLTKIFKELKKKSWTCAKCEELLQIIYNPSLVDKKRKGTTKGMKRKTARLAYMNTPRQKKLKEVMRLHHKEGYTLKEAWTMV